MTDYGQCVVVTRARHRCRNRSTGYVIGKRPYCTRHAALHWDGERLSEVPPDGQRYCTTCNGYGYNFGARCPSCIGTGFVPDLVAL